MDVFEAQVNRKLLVKSDIQRGVTIRPNTDRISRGSFHERVNEIDQAVAKAGVLTINEGRERLGYDPRPDGDVLISPKGAPPTQNAGEEEEVPPREEGEGEDDN